MTTKEKIINAAIKLFNKNGVSKVSLRHIASEIGISHGNLAYHYKNKYAILHAIYSRMDEEMSTAVYPPAVEINLIHYHNLLLRISKFQKRHRFFYMDLLEISRHFPEIIQRYRATIKVRREQMNKLFNELINKGLIKPESSQGLYASLTHVIWVMSTFWLQQEYILGRAHPAIATGTDIKHIWEVLLPHLSESGLQECKRLKNKTDDIYAD